MLPRGNKNSGSERDENRHLDWNDAQCNLVICNRCIIWGTAALVLACAVGDRWFIHQYHYHYFKTTGRSRGKR